MGRDTWPAPNAHPRGTFSDGSTLRNRTYSLTVIGINIVSPSLCRLSLIVKLSLIGMNFKRFEGVATNMVRAALPALRAHSGALAHPQFQCRKALDETPLNLDPPSCLRDSFDFGSRGGFACGRGGIAGLAAVGVPRLGSWVTPGAAGRVVVYAACGGAWVAV